VFALEPFATVMSLAEVNAIFQEIGEGTIGEGMPPRYFAILLSRRLVTMRLRSSSATSFPNDRNSRYSWKIVRTVCASDLLMTSFFSLAS
jgi:hypothetical protein